MRAERQAAATAYRNSTYKASNSPPNSLLTHREKNKDGVSGAGIVGGWLYFSRYPANDTTKGTSTFDVKQGSLYPYVKNAQVYICPSDTQGSASGNSYAANSCVFTQQVSGTAVGKAFAAFDAAADWMLLGEEAYSGSGLPSSDGTFLRTNSTDDGFLFYSANFLSTRHNQGSNCTFIDGHTKWMLSDQIVANKYQTGGTEGDACP